MSAIVVASLPNVPQPIKNSFYTAMGTSEEMIRGAYNLTGMSRAVGTVTEAVRERLIEELQTGEEEEEEGEGAEGEEGGVEIEEAEEEAEEEAGAEKAAEMNPAEDSELSSGGGDDGGDGPGAEEEGGGKGPVRRPRSPLPLKARTVGLLSKIRARLEEFRAYTREQQAGEEGLPAAKKARTEGDELEEV